MKHGKYLVFCILIALIFSACYGYYDIAGSGKMVQRELNYKNFTDITVNMHSQVIIRPSGTHRVLITADDNIIDLVTVYPDEGGDELVFGLDPAFHYEQHSVLIEIEMPAFGELDFYRAYYWTWQSGQGIDITIESGFTLTGLTQLSLPSGDTLIQDLTADELEISSKSGTLRGTITAGSLAISTSGGDVGFTGTADSLEVTTDTTDVKVDLEDFAVTDAQVDLASGEVIVNAAGNLGGTVDKEAVLKYKDNAGLNISNLTYDHNQTEKDDHIIPIP